MSMDDGRGVLVIAAVISALMIGFGFASYYGLKQKTDHIMMRAQVSADVEDMLVEMRTLEKNMEAEGMTKGHAAVIFTNASNDMGLQYRGVQRIIQRLESLSGLRRNSTTYQVALDDIRGTIRELPGPASGWYFAHNGGGALLLCFLTMWSIVGIAYYRTNQ